MRQGEKHRTALAIGSSVAIVAFAAALLPATAPAAPAAQQEYELDDLPSAGGDNETSASGANPSPGSSSTGSTPAIPAGDPGVDPSSGEPTESGGSGSVTGGADGADGERSGDRDTKRGGDAGEVVTSPESIVPAVTAASSDDGGAPIVLIVLAVIAAGCTGFAIYRLRGGSGQHEPSESAKS